MQFHEYRPAVSRSSATALLASAPPNPDADKRKNKLARCAHPVHLGARHGDPAIVFFLRPDGDQILIRRKPVHGIQGQVAIAVEADERIGRPPGAANDHEAPLRILLPSTVSSGRPDGQGAFFVLWIAGIDSG